MQGAFVLGYHKQRSTAIKQFQIDLATGNALSEQKVIWELFAKIATEGPHLYKREGFYCLVVAEGGTLDGRMLSVARVSDSVRGTFESCSRNPLLTVQGTNDLVPYTGHAELSSLQTAPGKLSYLVFENRGPLSVRAGNVLVDVSRKEGAFWQMSGIRNINKRETKENVGSTF